ncbi:uncharacterized protein LOC141617146 [Silene latifolia]|uniref:uncharacterized protein LOC141617146 n=1 Tax=Silene latifolia TaxID=37657 RepID=UPI003D77E714
MSKWSVHLSGYDIQYDPRTAIKSQALADFVADFSPAIQNLADEEILTLEGDREVEVWQMHIDRASNQREAAKELKQKFKTYKLKQIPRDQNVEADALATLGATFKPTELSSIPIAHMLEPSIQKIDEIDNEIDKVELEDHRDEVGVQTATEAGEGSQPVDQPSNQPFAQADDKKEVRAFRVKASGFILIDDALLRKSLAGGTSMSNKAVRQGYFWPLMREDATEYARKCDACQRSAPMIHQPAEPLHPIISP